MPYVTYLVVLLALYSAKQFVIQALSTGPPVRAFVCNRLMPVGHPGRGQDSQNLGYQIRSSKNWFNPNEVITIRIAPSARGGFFRGMIMQVRDTRRTVSGSFDEPTAAGLKLLTCNTVTSQPAGSTVSHSSPNMKPRAVFKWRAPPSCEGFNYTVRASVVQNFQNYQTGLTKSLECRPIDSSEVPPGTEGECTFSARTSIPAGKYTTSFESNDNNFNGWTNRAGNLWMKRSGRSPSFKTGPAGASDGNFYLYFETSRPASPGDRVILETDEDLRGCFCIKLQNHHNVDEDSNHFLEVKAGNEVIFRTAKNDNAWKERYIQVDTGDFVQVRIIGTRGTNYRGDMAVDNIAITAGSCPKANE